MPLTDFDTRFADPDVAAEMARRFPQMHDAARDLWNAAFADEALTARMRELVLLAIFASPAGYDQPMVDTQIERAVTAGASPEEVVDVLLTVAGVANHALYFALPLAEDYFSPEEMAEGTDQAAVSAVRRAKEEFMRVRGFWNPGRDVLGRTIPEYLLAAIDFSTAPAKHGSLAAEERELIAIAVDASVSHMSEVGLRIHYESAKKLGIKFSRISAVLKIVGVIGLLSYINSSRNIVSIGEAQDGRS